MTTPDIVLFVLLWAGGFVLLGTVAWAIVALTRNGTPTKRNTIPAWLKSQEDWRTMASPPPVLEVRNVICNVRFPINH